MIFKNSYSGCFKQFFYCGFNVYMIAVFDRRRLLLNVLSITAVSLESSKHMTNLDAEGGVPAIAGGSLRHQDRADFFAMHL